MQVYLFFIAWLAWRVAAGRDRPVETGTVKAAARVRKNGETNKFLAKARKSCRFDGVRTLTVEEATQGLDRLVELALAGEQIQIRKGSGIVELRPTQTTRPATDENLTPREALRSLQADARMTPQQAETYLHELREERLAAENRRPA